MPGMLGIAHQMANFTKQNCILLRKTRSKILCSCKGTCYAGIADILLRKTRSKILSSSKDSDFASQNKEDSHERTGNRKQQIR